MDWITEREMADPAYAKAYAIDAAIRSILGPGPAVMTWNCLNGCGVTCTEREGGVSCPACGEAFSWSQLAREEP
jgi:hypothetical protein